MYFGYQSVCSGHLFRILFFVFCCCSACSLCSLSCFVCSAFRSANIGCHSDCSVCFSSYSVYFSSKSTFSICFRKFGCRSICYICNQSRFVCSASCSVYFLVDVLCDPYLVPSFPHLFLQIWTAVLSVPSVPNHINSDVYFCCRSACSLCFTSCFVYFGSSSACQSVHPVLRNLTAVLSVPPVSNYRETIISKQRCILASILSVPFVLLLIMCILVAYSICFICSYSLSIFSAPCSSYFGYFLHVPSVRILFCVFWLSFDLFRLFSISYCLSCIFFCVF